MLPSVVEVALVEVEEGLREELTALLIVAVIPCVVD